MVKMRSSVRKKALNMQGIKAIMNQRINPFPAFRDCYETLMTGHAKTSWAQEMTHENHTDTLESSKMFDWP